MRDVSLHSIQQRHPWLMAPVYAASVLLTPERWASGLDGLTRGITRALVFDTTAVGRYLAGDSLPSRLREAVLPHSAPLRWLDWKLRKLFWTMVWCGVVALQLWPRRAVVPRPERPIRLLSAPETYADFQAPTLVVPGSVPRAENLLIVAAGTQMMHLLQDAYPLATTHQAPANADPQTRFDEAFTLLYRLTRAAPRWHPDLVGASRAGNLLGALGSAGPFAKLLHRVGPGTDDYVIDLRHFSEYPVRDGLCDLGTVIHYRSVGGKLLVTGIGHGGDTVLPGTSTWELTERIALAALATHLTVWRQGMEYHVGGLAAVPVLTHNYLPPDHPLRRLLAPHYTNTLTTNINTHVTLRRSGFDVKGFSFPYGVILRYYDDGAAAFDIARLDVALDARQRGIPDSLDYPWLPQAVRYYRIFEGYVRSYVDCYYPTEAALAADLHARVWFESLDQRLVRGIRHYVPDLTRDTLVTLCVVLMYSASVAHTENSLTNYAPFMPTTVRKDGAQQSVGEVQNLLNFQMLIATPVTLLLADASHLALDPQGGAIMRRFRQDLLDLQREMEQGPSRPGQLLPADVEASVSC